MCRRRCSWSALWRGTPIPGSRWSGLGRRSWAGTSGGRGQALLLIITARWITWSFRFVSCITVCWLNSVKVLRLRYTSFFVSFLAFGAVLAPTARGGEPVFNMQAAPVSEVLSPYRLPASFYTFDPDEYWAEPEDSWWLDFSNWVIRQERRHGVNVQSMGAWADQTLSGSSHVLPNNESYLRLGFAAES